MERIMRYRRLVREGRNCFSMYNDDVGRIQFEEKIITQEQIVRLTSTSMPVSYVVILLC